jgi:hypothetical protein
MLEEKIVDCSAGWVAFLLAARAANDAEQSPLKERPLTPHR